MVTSNFSLFALLLMVVVPTLPLHVWIRYLLRIGFGTAGLISLAINAVVATAIFFLSAQRDSRWDQPSPPLRMVIEHKIQSDQAPVYLLAMVVALNLAIALMIKLYRAAVLGKATSQEQSSGIAGVRAWLSPLNVITIVVVAAAAYMGFDYDYLGVFLTGLCLLLAYPLVNTMMQQGATVTTLGESASPQRASAEERQRILALVEVGKITAEDGAELLTALAQSQAAGSTSPGTLSGPRRVMLIGAAITLVGFFLPWFTINIMQAAQNAMNSMQQNMPQFPGGQQPTFNFNTSVGNDGNGLQVPVQNATQFAVRGGDVQHGLGWIILGAGLAAACLPFFWTPRGGNTRQMRNAVLTALAAGSVLVLYVLSGSFNAVTSIESGFILAIAGYVVLWVGSVREYVSMNARLRPVIAAI